MLRLERCSERPKAVIPIHPLLQTWNPMPSCSAPPCTAPRTTRLLVYTEACARILPTFPLKCPTLMMPRMLGLSERRRHGIWLHASQNPASPDSRAWFRSQSDTEFLLFFHTPHHNPYPKFPVSASRHPLFPSTPAGRPRDVKRRWRFERRGPGREAFRRRPGSRPPSPRSTAAQTRPRPTRRRRRRRLSAECRGGAGWVRRQLGRGRGRVGTGGGPTAAQLQPLRAYTRPGSRGRQRGPGEREEPASARPAVGGLVRHARRPPVPELGSEPPGRWCPGWSPEPWCKCSSRRPAARASPGEGVGRGRG